MSEDTNDKVADIRARLAAVAKGNTEEVAPTEPERTHPLESLYEIVTINPVTQELEVDYFEGYIIVTSTYIAIARGTYGDIMFFTTLNNLYCVRLAEDPDEV